MLVVVVEVTVVAANQAPADPLPRLARNATRERGVLTETCGGDGRGWGGWAGPATVNVKKGLGGERRGCWDGREGKFISMGYLMMGSSIASFGLSRQWNINGK